MAVESSVGWGRIRYRMGSDKVGRGTMAVDFSVGCGRMAVDSRVGYGRTG